MAVDLSRTRLQDLLVDPMEDLDREIKSWLDLAGNKDAKATLAKAALALTNHGGGFITIGLTEAGLSFIEAEGRPATLDGYGQDLINGIIQNYADPAFHCSVHLVEGKEGKTYPVIVVPGGHKVPVRAKRAGPNGDTVAINAIYVRKPGPKSEVPTSGQEWDELLARCLSNRRDELLDRIRDLISGVVSVAEAPKEPAKLDQWIEHSLTRWRRLTSGLPSNAPARCPHGFFWYAYEISGDLKTTSLAEFSELLQRSVVRHTGWPPFWYPTRPDISPYPQDGVVECWLGRDDPSSPSNLRDAAHADFWRISPDGYAFLLRGYQEDSLEREPPAKLFDVTLPVWRTGETLLHAERLSRGMVDGPAIISFAAHYTGLSGRELTDVSHHRYIRDGQKARQNEITLKTAVNLSSISPNLPEIVHPLLSPLYALFDFFGLPMFLVTEELAKLRGGRT